MKIRVQSQIVRQNIELFKNLVRKYSYQHLELDDFQTRIYTAFLNRLTGEIKFVDQNVESDAKDMLADPKSWKVIELRIKKHCDGEGFFEVAEEETNWRCFRCDDLAPPAYKVLVETVNTLNFVSKKFKNRPEMAKIVRELTSLEIESIADILSEKDIVHEAWHQVDRIGAERLLKEQIEGTFLFRKDPFAHLLEQQLSQTLNEQIKCVTLSFLEENGKVTDKTLVFKNGQWLIYNDDPNLEGQCYANINLLLDEVKDTLKMPLLN